MEEGNNRDKSKAIVILSGGMDSTTLLYYMNRKYDVQAITFDYGQRHRKEIECARKTCEVLGVKHTIVDISKMAGQLMKGSSLTDNIDVPEGHYEDDTMKLTVVPNRNSIMLNLAMAKAISEHIQIVAYAAHSGDHAIYPDCRLEFIEAIKNLAKVVDYEPIKIMAPFKNFDKGQIAVLGDSLGVDFSLTWTCYKGQDKPCGKCGACVERAEAFQTYKLKDPLLNKEK